MKYWKNIVLVVSFFVAGLILIIITNQFMVGEYSVIVRNPTEEQIMKVYEYSGEENRVWIEGAEKIMGDNSLIEIKMRVRQNEWGEKIKEVMEEAGIQNYVVGTPSRG